jgi:hypothetical protein
LFIGYSFGDFDQIQGRIGQAARGPEPSRGRISRARAYSSSVRPRFVIAAILPLAIVAVVAGETRSPERGPGGRAPNGPLFAVAHDGTGRWLVRVDPLTLHPGGRRVPLPEPVEGWARAPAGSRLAVVTDHGSTMRFVDVERMRALGRLEAGSRGAVAAVAWPRRDRIWLVLAAPGCCATGTTTVVTVDPVRRLVIARRRLAAGLIRVATTRDGPVLLLAPSATIGLATVATVDARGRVDLVPLGVSGGRVPTDGAPSVMRVRRPGLAVDPDRRYAYVLLPRPEVVEVDLRRRRVDHHSLSAQRSLVDRLRDLLEPRAEARPLVGPERAATWLPPGLLAVSGRDAHVSWGPDGALEQASRPAGLHLIDTARWRVYTVDEHAAAFQAANGLILTTPPGRGLVAYRPDGRRGFHLLENRRVDVAGTAGALAYVRADGDRSLHVVDLADGRVIAVAADSSPRPLLAAPGPWD